MSTVFPLARESLLIGGGVAMMRPIEIFLADGRARAAKGSAEAPESR
jgi:hypothetical protein